MSYQLEAGLSNVRQGVSTIYQPIIKKSKASWLFFGSQSLTGTEVSDSDSVTHSVTDCECDSES